MNSKWLKGLVPILLSYPFKTIQELMKLQVGFVLVEIKTIWSLKWIILSLYLAIIQNFNPRIKKGVCCYGQQVYINVIVPRQHACHLFITMYMIIPKFFFPWPNSATFLLNSVAISSRHASSLYQKCQAHDTNPENTLEWFQFPNIMTIFEYLILQS